MSSENTCKEQIHPASQSLLTCIGEYVASRSLGQYVLRKIDRFLWTIEKTAQWSVPYEKISNESKLSDASNENGLFVKTQPILVRPMPWVLFFPTLVFLRISRSLVNVFAFLMGLETVQAVTLVNIIQTRRRRIRAIRFSGMRNIRQRKITHNFEHKKSNEPWRRRFMQKIAGVLWMSKTEEGTTTPSKKFAEVFTPGTDKRKYKELDSTLEDEDSFDEENDTIHSLMDRLNDYANLSSDDDPDFEPTKSEVTSDSDVTNDTDDDSVVVETPSKKDQDQVQDDEDENCVPLSPTITKSPLKRPGSLGSVSSLVIAEENEDSDTCVSNNDQNSSTFTNEKSAEDDPVNHESDKNASDVKNPDTVEDSIDPVLNGTGKETDEDKRVRELFEASSQPNKNAKETNNEIVDISSSSTGEFYTPVTSSNGSPDRQKQAVENAQADSHSQ